MPDHRPTLEADAHEPTCEICWEHGACLDHPNGPPLTTILRKHEVERLIAEAES